ncbi:MAG: outer membrane beta-barrel protein [Candidatus Omnitrophica bacterium]|nr:outer membrane beta-barrel protein [Candidatus Omnitrophota bacterium]
MTAKSKPRGVHRVLAAVTCLLFSSTPALWAQEPQERERPELPPLTAQVSPEQALAAIKRRAQKILEARRAARRLKFYGELSQVVGYETNPATAAVVRKGDTYFEDDAYVMLSKKLTPTISWEGSYYGMYLQYLDYGDGDYTSHTFTPLKLKWQPGRMWRLESWLDYDLNYYPTAKDSGYRQFKTSSRIRQNLFGTTFHQLQYEFFERDYMTKNARDGAGNETFSNRVDARHRLRYKVGATIREALPLKNALFTVENDLYRNDSNDARNDFYDYDVWKITGALNGSATKKLSLNGSFAFERKNYRERPVSGLVAPARNDDKYTLASGATYTLNKTWRAAAALNFDHLGSNESTGEYDNMKYSLTVTAQF